MPQEVRSITPILVSSFGDENPKRNEYAPDVVGAN